MVLTLTLTETITMIRIYRCWSTNLDMKFGGVGYPDPYGSTNQIVVSRDEHLTALVLGIVVSRIDVFIVFLQ